MEAQQEDIELELTYLAAKVPPELAGVRPQHMVDVYFPDTAAHPRLRLRQKGGSYEITKKTPVGEGDASAHVERTVPLSESEFVALKWGSKRQIVKDRYNVEIDGSEAEVDVFRGNLSGLVLIDFEFDSLEAKAHFVAPDCCLADVTQEDFIAGGILSASTFADILGDLRRFKYQPLVVANAD